ncbi:MAG: PfaD family polyunsaturated fatty acid/polyketide biosynthesis protein [Candidatus Promineifilaceae bacterium]
MTEAPTTMPHQPPPFIIDEAGIGGLLHQLHAPVYFVQDQFGRTGAVQHPQPAQKILAAVPPLPLDRLGDPAFNHAHRTRYAYAAGAMANGIASEELVIALGQAGILVSFGAAGVVPDRLKAAIERIQAALPNGPYAFNLIHSPSEANLERNAVEMYLQYGVRTVEASAFMSLTPHIVRYRAAGLVANANGGIEIHNKVIAKLSRHEVAEQFMRPAPVEMLQGLVEKGLISAEQATLASRVPMADDITVEADSGGHTDNRSLVCLLPSILSLRDDIQAHYHYAQPIRVGAAGGIGTPDAALAAFMMGAAYIVTGSVNQGCLEAGTSSHAKSLLAKASQTDVTMAPAADMFEMGVEVQVLKRGTLFAMRAQKLHELYTRYDSVDAIPTDERRKIEKSIFKATLDDIWAGCVSFFNDRDPKQLERAQGNPKRKMALIFRWYLGLSSRWSNRGEQGRESDYQIWCGPAMGAFNDWVRGSYLESAENRYAVDIAHQIMTGAAYQYRLQHLKLSGINLPPTLQKHSLAATSLLHP